MIANVAYTGVNKFLGSLSLCLQFFGRVILPLGFTQGRRNLVEALKRQISGWQS